MRNWIEKSEWWLIWVIRLMYPTAIIIGLALGNYLIAYFGIETKAHATETYLQKTEQAQFNTNTVTLLKEQDKMIDLMVRRSVIDREHIVILNQKHNIPTKDYPIK
jgi:CBS domain containing-hemolysin-like protein